MREQEKLRKLQARQKEIKKQIVHSRRIMWGLTIALDRFKPEELETDAFKRARSLLQSKAKEVERLILVRELNKRQCRFLKRQAALIDETVVLDDGSTKTLKKLVQRPFDCEELRALGRRLAKSAG